MHDLLSALQRSSLIHIDVDWYNDFERGRLLAYPSGHQIAATVRGGVDISLADFLTYCLFVDQETGDSGSETFQDFRSELLHDLGALRKSLRVNGDILYSKYFGHAQKSSVSEKIGVGVSLAVISKIHNLIEADWERIPISATKSMDFSKHIRGSSSDTHVLLEAKGCSVSSIAPTASSHRKAAIHIASKKAAYRSQPTIAPIASYGCIGVIGTEPTTAPKCWLLDPPERAPLRDPITQQLINRLSFVRQLLGETMPNSQFIALLAERIDGLRDRAGPFFASDQQFPKITLYEWQDFAFRHVTDSQRRVSGRILKLSDGRGLFWGIHLEAIRKAVSPNLESLLGRVLVDPQSFVTELMGDPGASEIEPLESLDNRRSSKALVSSAFGSAIVHVTPSGRAFGVVGLRPRVT